MTKDAAAPTETLTVDWFLANADHTLLAPATTPDELAGFLASAKRLGVARVCISPTMLPVDPETLGDLEIVAVVGFPSGVHAPAIKAAEAALAVQSGAHEVDMVINRGAVKAGDRAAVEADVRAVRDAIPGVVLKVILETATLSAEEIGWACAAAEAAGADFVKTSTGFDPAGGASVEAVSIMADAVGSRLGVKASGGIRTAQDVRRMREAGATRFGVSATAAILDSWNDAETPSEIPGGPAAGQY